MARNLRLLVAFPKGSPDSWMPSLASFCNGVFPHQGCSSLWKLLSVISAAMNNMLFRTQYKCGSLILF